MKRPTYTQKTYRLIAQAISEASDETAPALITRIQSLYKATLISNLIQVFALDNPRFRPDIFRDACYEGLTKQTALW